MENNKASETLEEGFAELKLSQIENPGSEIVQGSGSVFSCNNLAESDVYSGRNEVSSVELAINSGNWAGKEYMVSDDNAGNNLINKGSLDIYPDDKLSVLRSDSGIINNNVANLEKVADVLHSHEPDSPTKIEVSGNCINLFVEVFGPLDGTCEINHNPRGTEEFMLGDYNESNPEYPLEENVTVLPPGFETVDAKNECTFDVGDVVWAKTRTDIWWPGMVSDPSDATNDTTSRKKGCVLVKYFGNANSVWCKNSDLKPFADYYEQFSGQMNSSNFYGSVERGLFEFGQRVKSTMTCPCFSKGSPILAATENSIPLERKCKFDALTLSQFEPANFVARIKHLGCSVQKPGRVELIVIKNQLSPFYCSVGHLGLPLQVLKSSSDGLTSEAMDEGHNKLSGDGISSAKAGDGDHSLRSRKKRNQSDGADLVSGDNKIVYLSGKGSELRERKKSKYLSFPYVDVKKGGNVEPTLEQETEDNSGFKSRKKGSKKPLEGHHVFRKADDIDASSAELLGELCSTARDSFYLSRSKYCDSLRRFYGSFRAFAFLGADITCKDDGAPKLKKCRLKNPDEAEVKMEGIGAVKKSKKQKEKPADSVKDGVEENNSKETDNQGAKGNAVRKRAKKKKEQVISVGVESIKSPFDMGKAPNLEKSHLLNPSEAGVQVEGNGVLESVDISVGNKLSDTGNLQAKGYVISSGAKKKKEQAISGGVEMMKRSFSMGTNNYSNNPWMINFQQTCSNASKSGTARIDSTAGSPDLNVKNHPSLLAQQVPVGGDSTNPGTSVSSPNVFGSVPSSKDLPETLSNNGVNGIYRGWKDHLSTKESEPNNNVMNSGFRLWMGMLSSAGKSEPRKRKRKEKTCQAASDLPDLNGNALDTNSPAKTLPEGVPHISSPEGQPQEKTTNTPASGNSTSNSAKTNKDSNNGEALGGSLLLSFSPDSTLPCREMLVSTFSRFGLLKESEIQVSSDSTVQIVYERNSDARFAFRSLEKGHTFGSSLVDFKLLNCPPTTAPKTLKKRSNNSQKPALRSFDPVDKRNKAGEQPDIVSIRRNVEMMKSTLEKAGASLSPEMRARLEVEIKVFLDKISSMTAGGSSSS